MGLRMHIQMTKSVVVCYGELSVVEFSTYDVRAYGASVLAVMLALVVVVFFFFFSSRRRHTRCSRDWFRRVLFRSRSLKSDQARSWSQQCRLEDHLRGCE